MIHQNNENLQEPVLDSTVLKENTEFKNEIEPVVDTNNVKVTKAENRIFYIYKITNLLNSKIYIGQSVQPNKRWHQHKKDSKTPRFTLQFAMNKYGVENFSFEIIACCKNQDDANYTETLLVSTYNSLLPNGYNMTHGGLNAPKSDAWKQSMNKWRSSLSEEEKQIIRNKQSEATKQQILQQGHPAQGHKWTEEQRKAIFEWRSSADKEAIYTPEVRQKMRESHLGHKQSEETLEKRSESLKAAWKKKNEIRCAEQDIRCHAEGCTINGSNIKYKIIEGIRYCAKHGSRIKRNGHINLLPKVIIEMTPEIRQKISQSRKGKCLGRIPHNKVHLTPEQIEFILKDERSTMQLSKDMGIGKKVIYRIRNSHKV